MIEKYTIGLDYGTNSVRALLVEVETGREIASSVHGYESGEKGIILDPVRPLLARHDPRDYLLGLESVVRDVLEQARRDENIQPADVIGLGVDTTGSTPIPVDRRGVPLSFSKTFARNPNALAWLWKDHTSTAEAEEITRLAMKLRPAYLGKVGGTYSSEWLWSKLLRCRRCAPDVFSAAWSWVEMCDWIPAILSGDTRPEKIRRSICAAGHKAFYHPEWGGWPDAEFLRALDPELARIASTFAREAFSIGEAAGFLSWEWAKKLGLPVGIPIAVGAFDAHLGGVGSGIAANILVKNVGTSTCDMMVSDLSVPLPEIPGLAGVVPDSILPGYYGLEAGQSAVGDIFCWFANLVAPGKGDSHNALQAEASKLAPGESGLLALDWQNGNRTILMDQRLTGTIVGLTLQSTAAEIYRALVEATAFGARVIIERFEEYGCRIDRVINCGGIAQKSPMTMQIYADVCGKTMEISRSSQTGALGGAIAAAVVARPERGGYADFREAIEKMTGVSDVKYIPAPEPSATYDELFALYRRLHDSFGVEGAQMDLYACMKKLIEIRDRSRNT
ncbi:MAG TPA: ribulokinase [Rectinemataceae bacterium]|nr:ribulokinase [Rectinemataceae bacterium]